MIGSRNKQSTNRRIPMTARAPRPKPIRKQQVEDDVTYEDINFLQKKRNNLIQERALLQGKIQRINSMIQSGENSASKDPNFQRELQKINEIADQKLKELSKVKNSDNASFISEKQWEIVIISQEMNRLQHILDQYKERSKIAVRKLQELVYNYSPDVLVETERKLKELRKNVSYQRNHNMLLKEGIARKTDSLENQENVDHVVGSAASDIERQIKQEEKEIVDIQNQIEEENEKYNEKVLQLKQCL